MPERPKSPSNTGNFVLFLLLAMGIVLLNGVLFGRRQPPAPNADQKVAQGKADQPGAGKAAPPAEQAADEKTGKAGDGAKEAKPADAEKKPDDAQKPVEAPPPAEPAKPIRPDRPVPAAVQPPRWVTLGSADPASRYRMLVTLSDRGAAVARIELNSPRYPALTDEEGYLAQKGGYLGRIVMEEDKRGKGCPVQVVGAGTPAEKAGLKPGDLITKLAGQSVTGAVSLQEALARTKPKQTVELEVLRGGDLVAPPLSVTLSRPPMEVIRPENSDPLSFLLTLAQVDGDVLAETVADKEAAKDERPEYVDGELAGLNLRRGTWEIARATQDEVEFRCKLPHYDLELVKTYRLAKVPEEEQGNPDYRGYHLVFEVSIRNTGQKAREVAYQLDGPTGLPVEGWWYSNKVGLGSCWSAGMRDFVFAHDAKSPIMIGCPAIAADKVEPAYTNKAIDYVGVDAVYFSSVLIPQKKEPGEVWFAGTQPLRVGAVKKDNTRITDTSCRMRSLTTRLAPGEAIAHAFEIFAGPKRPELLDQYQLGPLVDYGWFHFAAYPMVKILHFFHAITWNWGLAIILLTVLVRGLMFPMSRKQAMGAAKMAELQPEMRRIQEKYKKDLEARHRAQQELFRKHNYNPLSGCLVMLVQLPIFIGLYRGLMVDVELRGSPLLGSAVRWCSNLAAPDMLFDWHGFMPEFVNSAIGIFGLGPYFNLLPIATVVLFLLQQKMLMPPPADEQQAMQQNIMKYMMIFMGVMFFKVAAGLCVYFIASSLWGLAERKFLPKPAAQGANNTPPAPPPRKREKSRG